MESDRDVVQKLRSASTHWLRHTFATHGIHNGMTLETIRDLLGHRSLTTTSVYVTTEKDKRSREVEMLGELCTLEVPPFFSVNSMKLFVADGAAPSPSGPTTTRSKG